MKILYIDTTQKNLFLSFVNKNIEKPLHGGDEYTSVSLLKKIDHLLKEVNTELDQVDVFCVNTGPGSFTGTRTGVITAAFFAQLNNKKLVFLNKNDDIKNLKKYALEREDQITVKAEYDRKSYFEK